MTDQSLTIQPPEVPQSVPATSTPTQLVAGIKPETMGQVVEFAKLMSKSGAAVGPAFQGEPGLCLGVTMRALHWKMDPFALAGEAYVTNGVLSYQAKVMAAAVNAHAPISKPLDCEFSGNIEGTHDIQTRKGTRSFPAGDRKCKIVGYLVGDDEPRIYETKALGEITKKNSPLWADDPDQQLYYYAIRSWARRRAPEVLLGVLGADEVIDNPQYHEVEERKPLSARLAEAKAADAAQITGERGENDDIGEEIPESAPEASDAEVMEFEPEDSPVETSDPDENINNPDSPAVETSGEPEPKTAPDLPEEPESPSVSEFDAAEWESKLEAEAEKCEEFRRLDTVYGRWLKAVKKEGATQSQLFDLQKFADETVGRHRTRIRREQRERAS